MTNINRNLRLFGKGVLGLLSRAEVTATLSALSLVAAPAMAGPEGEQVVRGDVRFERRGNEMWITAGRNSIINYRSFDIASNESVRFIQPDANARVLNRVNSATPTRIDGSLSANGRVYIVNPAGVYFGQGAVVDVNSLHAAAGRMSDRDFLGNVDRFTHVRGQVMNEGQIRGNAVALVGQQVGNFGTIVAPQGTVVLAAGQDVIVGQRDGNVVVRIPRSSGNGPASVTNTGTINAAGGRVTMVAGDVLGAAMFNTGRIAASQVRLETKGQGAVNVSGHIDATSATGAGGTVRVLGEHVRLNNATIDASGTSGGTIMVGGNFLGQGSEARSRTTTVDANSTLRADGSTGDAGRVVAWSDGTTRFDGIILARAQGDVGTGGVAEVSGKEHVAVGGHAYLHGKTGLGQFLIDPGSVTITDGPNTAPGGALDTFNDGWVIDQLENGGATLTISTTNSTNAAAEDLTVDATANLTYTSANLLVLQGTNSVTINGIINNAGTGGLSLSGGDIAVNAAVSVGGSFVSTGASFNNTATINAGLDVTLTHTGTVDVNANITAGQDFESINAGISGTFDSTGFTIDANGGGVTIDHSGDAVAVGALDASAGVSVVGANVTQTGAVTSQSYDVTATGLMTVDGAVAVSGLAGFTSNSDGFTNGVGGTITASHAAGQIDITSTASNIALDGALTAGTGGITLVANSGGQIAQNAAATTTGVYEATASNQYSAGATITGTGIAITSGTSGVGNLALNASTLRADGISIHAGDGSGTSTTASVNLTGNPTFANTAGTSRPNSFTMQQDAGIADAGIAALARFQGGSIAGMDYILQSEGGSITNSTANKLNGTNLTLLGATGVTLAADLSLASLDVTGATTLSANLTTGTGTMRFRSAVALGATNRSLTGGEIDLEAAVTSTGGGLSLTNSDTLTILGAISLTGSGAFNQTGGGNIQLNANVTTQDQNVSFNGPIALGANVTLNAGTATIDLADDVDIDNRTLTLTADEIDLGGAGAVSGAGGTLILQPSTDSVSIGVAGGAGTLDISAADLAALGTGIDLVTIGRSSGTHAITINAATITHNTTFRAGSAGTIAIDGDIASTGALTFLGTTTLNADVVTESNAITLTGDVILGTGQTDYTLSTIGNASAGADISISGTTNSETAGAHGLDLVAGAGNISAGNIGNTARLSFLRIVSADDATFGTVAANDVLQTAGAGLTTFGNITAEDEINLVGTNFAFQDAQTNGTSDFFVQNSGTATFNGDLTLGGAFVQAGTGGVSLGGDITTDGLGVDITGPVTLATDATITTNGGLVFFASTVNGTQSLTVDAGTGDVEFVDDVGGVDAIDVLTVLGDDVVLRGTVEAAELVVNADGNVTVHDDIAAGTLTLRGGLDGVGNLSFAAAGIELAGNAITLAVGDAASGGTASLNLATNTPTFAGTAGGATSPTSLTLVQDAAFTDADLPGASAFGNGLSGLTYSITSRDGSVTIADASKVADTFLTLNGATGVDVGSSLLLRSFTTDSNMTFGGDLQTSGDITINGTLTLDGATRFNSGVGATTLDDVVAGTNDFAVTADSLTLNGTLTGSRTLVLQPGSASRDIRLGGASASGTFFELNQAELARITDGWSQIYLGSASGAGLLYLAGDVTLLDPTIFRMSSAGGRMDISRQITGDGNASLRFQSAGNITLYDNVVSNGNFIEFDGNVVLQDDAVIDSTNGGTAGNGADISFRGLIDSAPSTSNSLNISAGVQGSARLEEEVGFFHDLDSLTISGAGIQLGKVTTANSQTYNGVAYLGGNIVSTTGGSIIFGDRVFLTADTDIISAGAVGNNITITSGIDSLSSTNRKAVRLNSGFGDLTVTGNSGQNNRLSGFGATGANISTGGVRAVGNIIYTGLASLGARLEGVIVSFNNNLNLTAHTTVVATSSATFAGTVNSAANQGSNLIVNSPITTFIGDIGAAATRELGRLATSGATNISASTMRTLGSLSLGGNVQLNDDVNFTSGIGGIEFLGGMNSDSAGTPRSIVVTSPGTMFFAGSIGNLNRLASITTSGGGGIRVAGPVIRTTATQDYASAVTVDGDVTFTGSNISFASTINSGSAGARSVTVTAAGGGVTFSGAVGNTAALSQLSVTATSFTLPSVRTTGSQTYTGITTLTGNLTSTTSGAIAFSGASQLDSDVTITTAGAAGDNVSFASTLNSRNTSRALTISAGSGNVTLGSDVGLGTGTTDRQLSSISVTGGAIALQAVQTQGSQSFQGTTTARGALTSTGSGSITLGGSLVLGTNLVLTTASGGIFVDANVDSDSTTRSLTLSSGGGSVKRLGGVVGAVRQLSTITINSDGSTVFAGPAIKTSGNQTYSGNVSLANNVTISSPAAVTFIGTIDADSLSTLRTLAVDSSGGTATTSSLTISGAVGATAPLFRLQTAGPGSARLGGNITVTNGIDFFGPVKLLSSITLDSRNGSQMFRSTIDTEVNLSPANLTLLSTRLDSRPDRAPFKFAGSIGTANALANLTFGPDRSDTFGASSIVFADTYDTNGRILASAVAASDSFVINTSGNFNMGVGHKLLAMGRLRITAGGSATLGDLTSLADITVNSTNIILRARAPRAIYDNTFEEPDLFPVDTGTDFVAAGGFVFSSVPTVIGTGNAPIFASNSGTPNARLENFGFRRYSGNVRIADFADTRPGGTNFLLPLDLMASGASAAPLATAVPWSWDSGITPSQAVSPAPLTSSMQASLADMGIQTRGLTPDETIDYLVGNATYDDVRPRAGLVADDYRVATNRITAPAARRAIAAYRALVFKTTVDASGTTRQADRTADIKESLARAFETYATQATSPSGLGFRAYLENRRKQASTAETRALSELNAARNVLTSIRAIGLSEYEASIPRRKIIAMIRPDSISDQQLVEAIFGAPVRN
jgi:filamentous hemagglutinin family protein